MNIEYPLINPVKIEVKNKRFFIKDTSIPLHCSDGPAIIDRYGNSIWFYNGFHHRVNGRRYIMKEQEVKDGSTVGFCIEMMGPATTYINEQIAWWYRGFKYPFEDWCKYSGKTGEEMILLKFRYIS